MAKLPGSKTGTRSGGKARKGTSTGKAVTGGKNLSLYMNQGSYKGKKGSSRRRFSIAESSSSDSEDSSEHNGTNNDSDSPSDSSLTAVSDNAISETSSLLFDEDKGASNAGTGKYSSKGKTRGKGKSLKGYGKKGKKKTWGSSVDDAVAVSDEDEDEDDEQEDDDEQVFYDQEEFGDVGADEDDEDDSDEGSESGSSSSDDSDIDFVKLQAQKKIRSMTPVDHKSPQRKRRASGRDSRRDSGSVPRPKFGRRRSEAALPEDIDFTFEFNDKNYDSAVEDDSDDEDAQESDEGSDHEKRSHRVSEASASQNEDPGLDLGNEGSPLPPQEEEDIGEEVGIPSFPGQLNPTVELDLDFNNQLTSAPKFSYDDINSDDDYEIDDNELLATLQADNDMEEFNKSNIGTRRHGSVVSMDEEDDENEFLKEEEKFLVNEFENNGFDEEPGKDSAEVANETNQDTSHYDDYEDEDDEDEDGFIDFTISDDVSEQHVSPKKNKKQHNSDDEDDSYLWNYFFSSDNDSDDEYESAPHASPKRHKKSRSHSRKLTPPPAAYDNFVTGESDDQGYDSSESTDIDSNIPANANNSMGSQKAKEVLSSKTADYRPPVLGTWVAIESKPFGIIDGLSTRTLTGQPPNSIRPTDNKDRQRTRKSIVTTPHNDDSALGLDELLNMSDMDYDDTNDVKIWRDFNNQKQRVPLGAFRNKSLLENSLNQTPADPITSNISYNHTSKTNSDFNQRRYSLNHHKGYNKPARRKSSSVAPVPSRSKRRRASKVEAFSEGYRPTKSGLFSEQALVDVEEVLGDDNDIMALIKGL